jgi:hypothetical protein
MRSAFAGGTLGSDRRVNYFAAAASWGHLNCGVTRANTGGISVSISALRQCVHRAAVTSQSAAIICPLSRFYGKRPKL